MPQGCGEEDARSPAEWDAGGRLPGRITVAGLPPPIGNRDKSETLARECLLKRKI